MRCRSARRLIPLHSGSDLPLSKAGALERHLAECATCCEELDAYRHTRQVLLSVREEDVQASGIWASLAPRLEAVDAAQRLQKPWYRRPQATVWAGRAAAAVLVLAATPFLLQQLSNSGLGPNPEDVPNGDGAPVVVMEQERKGPGLTPVDPAGEELFKLLGGFERMPENQQRPRVGFASHKPGADQY